MNHGDFEQDLDSSPYVDEVDGKHCVSCMSKFYGDAWTFAGFGEMYLLPKTFTDACADPSRARDRDEVQYRTCHALSNCITIMETMNFGEFH